MRLGVGRLLALALCMGPLTGSTQAAETDEPWRIAIENRPFEIEADRMAGAAARFVGGLRLSSEEGGFGGISGALWRDGTLIAVTDRGRWLRFSLSRDRQGRILSARAARMGRLLGRGAIKLRGLGRDAEAIAHGAGGDLWIAFEGDHRVTRRDRLAAPATGEALALPSEILPFNSGIEALASQPDGTLWAIAEGLIGPGESIQGWRLQGAIEEGDADGIQAFQIPPIRGYEPTGADIGPDGALYLLERRYNPLTGVRMRVRRFPAATLAAVDRSAAGRKGAAGAGAGAGAGPDLGAGETLLALDPRAPIDNMEGLSVASRDDGRLTLTAISDDNFNIVQRTVLLQFLAAPAD